MYQCEHCDGMFPDAADLAKHIDTAHPEAFYLTAKATNNNTNSSANNSEFPPQKNCCKNGQGSTLLLVLPLSVQHL